MDKKVLIFPAGTEIGLEIYNSLRQVRGIELYGAGEGVVNHALYLLNNYYEVPSVHQEGWLYHLVAICEKLEIDFLYPAHDDVLLALSRERNEIPAKIIAPSFEVCSLARSKSDSYQALEGVVPVPHLYANIDQVKTFPVLIKPDRGQGAQGVKRIDSREQLEFEFKQIDSPIISEYLPGEEYTVDCFSDSKSKLMFASARQRKRIRNGIAVNTEIVELPEARELAEKINSQIGLTGPWFFQIKRSASGVLTLLEFSPRIAGSMSLHRVQGINFPLMGIYEKEGVSVKILEGPSSISLDRALKNRYRHTIEYDTLYIDLDDTLIMDGKVNTDLIKLIYQAINADKRVILITRHAGNLQETLSQHRISTLFDEIIHINNSDRKSIYMNEKNAIFVDDSFSERLEVANVRDIQTFDLSMIELLIEGKSCGGK